MKIKSAAYAFLFSLCCLHAQSSASPAGDILLSVTPLTGTEHVKIIASTGSQWKPGQKLSVTIRAADSSSILWEGIVSPKDYEEYGKHFTSFTVDGLKPLLWEPAHPHLYEMIIRQENGNEVITRQRLGFRTFESKNGQLLLNGKPIFLRGIAINPPGRGIPESLGRSRKFAEDYVRYMKSIHVNIIRLQVSDETWYNVCDELGMMTFGGNYGGSVDVKDDNKRGIAPEPDHYDESVQWLKQDKLGPIAHHPCLMIYAVTNETPFKGAAAVKWEKFLAYATGKLEQWDHSRAYISNAGYGYGKSGDICDIHRYWGWYYASPYTFLNIRYNDSIIPFKKKVQPITFSECVGNYTGPDGRYNLSPNHKNPGSQLNWTGHAPDNEQAFLANEHQSFTFKQAAELFRRLRVTNGELSGLFPFTIMFLNWHTISSFADMLPKPVTAQAKLSYSPVLLSWECWSPNLYAGNILQPVAHIVNDDDEFHDLKNAKLVYQLTDDTKTAVTSDTIQLPDIPYYSTWQQVLKIVIPASLPEGNYELKGEIFSGKKTVSVNYQKLYIVNKSAVATVKNKIHLYDAGGKTEKAFAFLGIPVTKINSLGVLPAGATLVIGENAVDDALVKQTTAFKNFLHNGGRVIVMKQDVPHITKLNTLVDHPVKVVDMELENPSYPPPQRPSSDGYYVNAERSGHPLFAGIERENLKVWSDYTGWNETKPGYPAIHPVSNGFALGNKSDIDHVAVLANYGPGLEGIAVAEFFEGKGSLLLTGLDLAGRAELDPMADRFMLNMLSYMSGKEAHNLHVLVSAPIKWGDYASENGLLTGVNSGLIVNGKPRLTGSYSNIPVVITEEGDEFAGKAGGWNDRPGIQYVAYGRRVFGPYDLRGLGVPRPLNTKTTIGSGSFWCRVPAGTNTSATIIWNPSDKPLPVMIKINSLKEVARDIQPGANVQVDAPVDGTTVHMSFVADRRLVLLETTFKQK